MARMKRVIFFLMLALPVMGQAAMLETKPPMQSENLASLKVVPPPANLGAVNGISVTLEATDGFARDVALTDAARKGLPQALAQLEVPVGPEKAAEIAKSVGEPMQFVKSYKIVKELLVPTYSLTVDMVYDVSKLQANFGKVETVTAVSASSVSGSWVTSGATPAAVGVPVTVTVEASGAANQDKVHNTLSKAGLKPVWKIINRDGGQMMVTNPGTLDELRAKVEALGFAANVVGDGLTIRVE
jgi:hypothetical protein